MANVSCITDSAKVDLLNGVHVFGTGSPDTFKAALYSSAGSLGASTTAYSATNELANGSGYTTGGVTVTNANAPAVASNVAYWTPSANFQWTSFTASSFDAVLLYNSSKTNKAVAVFNFGSQSVTSGTFTLQMPTNNNTTGLIRLS